MQLGILPFLGMPKLLEFRCWEGRLWCAVSKLLPRFSSVGLGKKSSALSSALLSLFFLLLVRLSRRGLVWLPDNGVSYSVTVLL